MEKYIDLISRFPPKPIKSNEEKLMAAAVIASYLDGEEELSREVLDFVDVWLCLIQDYEERQANVSIPDIHGVEMLKALMTENNLRQKDLADIFGGESVISNVLHGKRQLSCRHITELSQRFRVSPAVFFPRNEKDGNQHSPQCGA